jgi:3-hydroxyisobutyrate dehydrogenase-like beta-hydroxyacid dehydrogenase
MKMQIGFIGLGQMGEPMARNLVKDFDLRVFNRTPGKDAGLVAEGATRVARPKDLADCSVIVTMVANDQALEEVALGTDGFGANFAAGGVHLSMSTVSPATSRKLAERHDYVAAPVFGRPPAAAAKKLWICASGSARAKERVRPLLDALGQGVYDFGEDPGAANIVKVAGNFMMLAATEAMAEAFTLAEKNGIARDEIAKMLTETVFACPIYQNYSKQIAAHAYRPAAFPLPLGMKDIDLVLQAAAASKMPMPLAHMLKDRLLSGLAKGRADMDWTSIALGVSEDAGVKS